MWIRSQNKETLIDIKHLAITCFHDKYIIYTDNHLAPNEMCSLGTYKTKEKALKVLDEISVYITNHNKPNSYYAYKIFQMPKDIIEVKPHEIGERPWLDPE